MKNRFLKTTSIICCLFSLVWFTSCNKESSCGDTIILLGTESYITTLNDMIPDSLQVVFPQHFGQIPEGYIPPNVEGAYKISQKEYCYSNFVNLFDNTEMYLRITEQHNRKATVELYEGSTVVTDTAYVMGHDQFFTLYFLERKEMTLNYYTALVDRCVVISGEKTNAGINNLMFGSIILNAYQGSNPFIGNFVPGWYFIYKDKDGLSENCNWFDNQ